MITIIDYGMGNLRSVQKAIELFYSRVKVSDSFIDIVKASKIVLPGVGAFGKAMEELKKRELIEAIIEVIQNGVPFLGICLGFQLLFSESEEGGKIQGLGIVEGLVRRFDCEGGLKVPHIGWNRIRKTKDVCHPLLWRRGEGRRTILDGVKDGGYMYFVHSYYAEPKDKSIIIAETDYGRPFASGIQKDNIYGFQFHPEKSQTQGLKIIKNFVAI